MAPPQRAGDNRQTRDPGHPKGHQEKSDRPLLALGRPQCPFGAALVPVCPKQLMEGSTFCFATGALSLIRFHLLELVVTRNDVDDYVH
jgi:hypothetical protein